jgi:hypothetical protein
MTYQANTILQSSSGRSAIEIKKDNMDGTFVTVLFDRRTDGQLTFRCGEYDTSEKKITSILDNDLTILN